MLGLRALVASTLGRQRRLSPTFSIAALLIVAGGAVAVSALIYQRSLSNNRSIPGLLLLDEDVGELDPGQMAAAVSRARRRYLRGRIGLRLGEHVLTITRAELGVIVDERRTVERLNRIGKLGAFYADILDRIQARRGKRAVPLAVRIDRERASAYFSQLKSRIDRPMVASRLDLARGVAVPGRTGYRLHIIDALAAAEVAVREDADLFDLPVERFEPKGNKLTNLDISHVLGEFTTVYSQADKDRDRAFNLKHGAARLDGLILRPKQKMSFNEIVGPRNRAQGYRTAPVISQGELVDGMAGGACQLSSTLFAAAFFAGLDLLSSRPHTIPSSYIKMGLDAAVAYPSTDLVIANPYTFPVVLHYVVSQGRVTVKVRGKKRPWRRVAFTRQLLETTPFKEIIRDDPTLPRGKKVIAQRGIPGFKFERRRSFFADGTTAAKVEKREIRYPPTTQIIKRGTGPADANWKPPPERRAFSNVPEEYTQAQ